uniref:Uncharacterized protein n=1 Tax=Utricularia reniformis TaxID=192314 RepID=A0A1Y0B482_9LAMI|nr:hypothetical protein AEK19_MT2040 [Utricularia reniformis]ART32198.1 hypothetical protein AEK19_MT2040 [Utricularia reniformis]
MKRETYPIAELVIQSQFRHHPNQKIEKPVKVDKALFLGLSEWINNSIPSILFL